MMSRTIGRGSAERICTSTHLWFWYLKHRWSTLEETHRPLRAEYIFLGFISWQVGVKPKPFFLHLTCLNRYVECMIARQNFENKYQIPFCTESMNTLCKKRLWYKVHYVFILFYYILFVTKWNTWLYTHLRANVL